MWTRDIARLAVPFACALSVAAENVWSQDKPKPPPFSSVVLTETAIGNVSPGRYAFRVTLSTIAPRAEIPFHVHCCPGVRYMLEGALTIHWADRGAQTFSAGSTYYEGAGANHPTQGMTATNPFDATAKVLIIELVRVD